MKPRKAAKSASDIGLRSSALSAASSRSAFPAMKRKKTYSPPAKGKGKKAIASKSTSDKPKKVRSTRENKDSNIEDAVIVEESGPINVKSERMGGSKPKAVGGKKALPGSKPKAIGAPPSKPKGPKGPKVKKEKTQTVFIAEPKVQLDEGPDFGKITHDITKTKQPLSPRQFR